MSVTALREMGLLALRPTGMRALERIERDPGGNLLPAYERRERRTEAGPPLDTGAEVLLWLTRAVKPRARSYIRLTAGPYRRPSAYAC